MVFHLIWFLNGISLVAISFLSFYCFFVWSKNQQLAKIKKTIGVTGLCYIVYSSLVLLWSLEVINPIGSDFPLIVGIFNVFKAILFVILIYYMIRNKNLLYFLFLFLLTTLAILFSINTFFLVVSLASYAIMSIASFDLFLLPNRYLKRVGILSLTYSTLSIFLLIFVFFEKNILNIWWFVPNILLFLILVLFILAVKHSEIDQYRGYPPKIRKAILSLLFLKFIIFLSSVTLFILLSTIAIHEMGHSLTAQYYGCERSKAVIYDITGSAHTEMVCSGYYNDDIITIAGTLFPIAVGLIFFLTGGAFTTNIAYLIFGFALILPSKDLEVLGVSESITYLLVACGFVIMVYGVLKLSINYMKQKGGLFAEDRVSEASREPEKQFWINEKTPVKDLYELVDELHDMSNTKFRQLVNGRKKDLLRWISDILKEQNLAKELQKVDDRRGVQIIILTHLLNRGADYNKNIFKYVCYPILRKKVGKKVNGEK